MDLDNKIRDIVARYKASGIHRVNVNRNIRQLVDLGILTRVGSDRKGYLIISNIRQ